MIMCNMNGGLLFLLSIIISNFLGFVFMELVLNHFNKIFLPQLKIFDMIRKIAIIGFFSEREIIIQKCIE